MMVRSGRLCVLAAGMLVVGGAQAAFALDWNGAISNRWLTAGNWVGGVLPTTTSDVYVTSTGSYGWPQLDGSSTIRVLRLGGPAGARLDILPNSTLTTGTSIIGGPVATSSNYLGQLRISGPAASYVSGFMDVGYSGIGSVTVENGGLLNVNYATGGNTNFGNEAGSSGSLLVLGAGSRWLSTANAVIGNAGTGRVEISNGGSASIRSAQLGTRAGGSGTLLVDGRNTRLDLTNSFLVIGGAGQGNVTISNGATVSSYERFWLGNDAGGSGRLTVTGAGSLLQGTGPIAGFTIGYFSAGDVLIDAGGTISAYTTQMGLNPGATGRLVVSGAGSRLVGTTTLTIGSRGSAEVTVRDGGTVSYPGRTANVATGAGSSGVINIGAAAGQAAASPGYLDVARVQLGPAGNGRLVFNHLSGNYVFTPAIGGNGSIEHYAGVTTLTGDNSALTGTTSVLGGKLVANGAFGGVVSVASGSRLGGTGTIGATTIQPGAVHAPGNSIGTQTINGNYVNHGTLEIEATPTATDRLIVNGGVDLAGATLNLLLSPATAESWPIIGPAFTIIENDGTDPIVGTFASITGNLFFLDNVISYAGGDGNDLAFAFNRNNVRFSALALTPNQAAVAAAIDTLALGNPIWNAMAVSSDAAVARRGLELLSGEVHASVLGGLVEDSRFVRDAVGEALARRSADDPAFWLRGYGNWRDTDGTGNAASYDSAIGGVLAGVDGEVADWRLGLLAGYGHTDLDIDARLSSADIDSYHLGLYAGRQWGPVSFRSGLSYSWHRIETQRSVVVGGFGDALSADYDAATTQVFGEFAYAVPAGRALFEPFANLARVHVRSDGFTERGGAAALSSPRETDNSTMTTIGLRASTDFDLAGQGLSLSGSLGWRHAFGDVDPTRTLALAGSGAFAVEGAPIARNVAVVGLSLEAALSSTATLGLGYQGQFSGDANEHNVKARLQVSF